jgi:hypothetical protein
MTSVLDQVDTYSPEALAERLGPELYAMAVESALNAPVPSPAKVEAVRRILERSVASLARKAPERPRLSRVA